MRERRYTRCKYADLRRIMWYLNIQFRYTINMNQGISVVQKTNIFSFISLLPDVDLSISHCNPRLCFRAMMQGATIPKVLKGAPLHKAYLKWRTEILDSCCKRPHATTGLFLAIELNFEATPNGTSLMWSLAYEPAGIHSSKLACSISLAFARTCFCVLVKLSNAKVLAYSGGRDSWIEDRILDVITSWEYKNLIKSLKRKVKEKQCIKLELTLGSHDEVLKDLRPLYFANRFRAGTSIGVSTSSGNSKMKNSSH